MKTFETRIKEHITANALEPTEPPGPLNDQPAIKCTMCLDDAHLYQVLSHGL